MKLSAREMVLVLLTVSAVVFGGTLILGKSRLEQWKELRASQKEVITRIEDDEELIAEESKWREELSELSKLLPQHPKGVRVGAHWVALMRRIATKSGVKILRQELGEEKQEGEVYELPIECRDWEGTDEAFIGFLIDLEADGAMLDIRQLLIKPKGAPGGVLRGRFRLYCAYRRSQGDA